ncbi:terpene synthase family protein [Dactylosporangium sp. CA-139066]|uniref:terpene synthase family protein n=1 Tax=Dactylosporangium sp. CA-139066 TaxID=3239930 RepID=UPI003D93870C
MIVAEGCEQAEAVAQAIGTDLCRWGRAGGADVDLGLAMRLAGVVAAITPDLDVARLTVLARYTLWTFLVDDELDDTAADAAVLAGLAARLSRVARAAPAGSGAPHVLETMLAELVESLRAASASPALLHRFSDALCVAIDTGVQHTVRAQAIRQRRAAAPTVVEYLSVAAHHVNYRSFAYALLILAGPDPASVAGARTDMALTAAARAVRIANDLRSVDRDRAAGRLNVMLLPPGAMDAAALERQIDHYVRLHDRLLRDVAEADVLRRSLRVAVGIYRVTDLR